MMEMKEEMNQRGNGMSVMISQVKSLLSWYW